MGGIGQGTGEVMCVGVILQGVPNGEILMGAIFADTLCTGSRENS